MGSHGLVVGWNDRVVLPSQTFPARGEFVTSAVWNVQFGRTSEASPASNRESNPWPHTPASFFCMSSNTTFLVSG